MKKWRLVGGITLVFILGVLAGALGTQLYHSHRLERFRKDPAERREAFLKMLNRELGLTPRQNREIRVLVEDLDKKLEAYNLKKHADIKKLFDENFARIKERLTPDQQRKLKEMRAKHEERRKKRKKKPPF